MDFQSGGFRRRRNAVTLDLTPLIDCIFQLLVFFLLTASFIAAPNLGVELPKASSKTATSKHQDFVISIARDGAIRYQNKILAPKALIDLLREKHKTSPDARVLIRADKKAYHGDVVRVMDAAKSSGFRRLGVAIRQGQ